MNSEYFYQSGCKSESDDRVTWENTDDSDYIPHHLPESLKIVSWGSIAICSVVVDGGLRPGQVKKQDCNTFLFGDGYECCSLSHTDRLPCTVLKVLGLKYSASFKAIMNLSRLKSLWIISTAKLCYCIKNYCAGQFNLGCICITEAKWNAIAQHAQVLYLHHPNIEHFGQLANLIPSTVLFLIMFGCLKPSCSYRATAASGQPKEDTNITRHYWEKHGTREEDLIKFKFKPTPVQKCFLLESDGNSTVRTYTFCLLPWKSSPLHINYLTLWRNKIARKKTL